MGREAIHDNLAILQRLDLFDEPEYNRAGKDVWEALFPIDKEQLIQLLFRGPVWDGHVVSKPARDVLIDYGLAVRCCMMGEQGYTAATYLAYTTFRLGGAQAPKAQLPVRG
jgi:hypothetical protein